MFFWRTHSIETWCQEFHHPWLLHPIIEFMNTLDTIFFTYFTIDSVFPLVVLSMGGSHGFSFIFVYAVAIGTAQQWFPENNNRKVKDEKCFLLIFTGLMGSIVVSGYGFGSLVWIPAELLL